MRSRKAQRQAPPDKPETGDAYHSRGSCAGEKTEHLKRIQAARPPPTTTTTMYHSHDSNIIIGWSLYFESRVCRLAVVAVVAAAAAYCSYCDNENPAPPNEARAIRRGGRRAISDQVKGRVVDVCVSIGRVDGAYVGLCKYPTCSNEST